MIKILLLLLVSSYSQIPLVLFSYNCDEPKFNYTSLNNLPLQTIKISTYSNSIIPKIIDLNSQMVIPMYFDSQQLFQPNQQYAYYATINNSFTIQFSIIDSTLSPYDNILQPCAPSFVLIQTVSYCSGCNCLDFNKSLNCTLPTKEYSLKTTPIASKQIQHYYYRIKKDQQLTVSIVGSRDISFIYYIDQKKQSKTSMQQAAVFNFQGALVSNESVDISFKNDQILIMTVYNYGQRNGEYFIMIEKSIQSSQLGLALGIVCSGLILALIGMYLVKMCCRGTKVSNSTSGVLYTLPTVSYKQLAEIIPIEQMDKQCPICLDTYMDQSIVTLAYCGHYLHQNCLNAWNHKDATCPICRVDLSLLTITLQMAILNKHSQGCMISTIWNQRGKYATTMEGQQTQNEIK